MHISPPRASIHPAVNRRVLLGAGVHAVARGRRTCCAGARECIFCRICKEAGSPSSRVLYQDERVVVLPDIRPAAAVHLLVLPKAHIDNVTSLTASDVELVRHMVTVGEQLLQQQDQQLQLPHPAQHKFGFHKPPFRSVDHLHLHCFTLPHKWYRWVQYQSDLNWVTADTLIDQLRRQPSTAAAAAAGSGTQLAARNGAAIPGLEGQQQQQQQQSGGGHASTAHELAAQQTGKQQ